MPPASSTCTSRRQTVYFGVVSGYKRMKGETWLKIDTDYDTTEEVTVWHGSALDASAHYLYRGQPFTRGDFAKIEQKRGLLRPGVRANAWICNDGKTQPLIDWQGASE